MTRAEFGQIVGLSTRQLHNLEAQGLPHRAEGRRKFYPLPDAVLWIRQRDVENAVAKVQPTGFDDARAREMNARAEKAELEVAALRRQVLTVDDFDRRYSAALAQLRAALLALPGRIAAELPIAPVESLEIIEPIVHGFMAELSEEPDDEVVDDAA